jgi:hypothetical protein
MNRLLAALAACAMVCLVCAGCGEGGPELGTVTGQVTMDGKPLPNVLVTFVPESGGDVSTAVTNDQGNYELIFGDRKGALPGKHKVVLTTIAPTQAAASSGMTSESSDYEKQAAGGSVDVYAAAAAWKEPIPEQYNVKSDLVKEVAAGSNVINLELKSS